MVVCNNTIVLLSEITDEMDDIINRSLQGQQSGEVLVEGYRLQITRGDIATLAGLNWLNDEVIVWYSVYVLRWKVSYDVTSFNNVYLPK